MNITSTPTSAHPSRRRFVLQTARVVSALFSPFYIMVYACALVLTLSHLSFLSLGFRALLLALVWFFAVLLPRMLIRFYLRIHRLSWRETNTKRIRIMPYALTVICYTALLYLLVRLLTPHILVIVPFVAVAVITLCMLINFFYKVSVYTAASGAAVGLLMGYSIVYAFEATGWICLCVLLCGLISTSRIVLRRHTLGQTALGASVGFACALFCTLAI